MCKPLLWESSLNDVTQFLIFPQSLTEHIVLSLNFLIVSIENLKKDSKNLMYFIESEEDWNMCVARNSKFEETLLSRKCIPDKFDGRGLRGKGVFSFFSNFSFPLSSL